MKHSHSDLITAGGGFSGTAAALPSQSGCGVKEIGIHTSNATAP